MTGAQALIPIRLVHRHRSMQVIVVNVDLEYIPISPAQVAGLSWRKLHLLEERSVTERVSSIPANLLRLLASQRSPVAVFGDERALPTTIQLTLSNTPCLLSD
jgi:hypothetical protein